LVYLMNATWNSRRRVEEALNHREPDRVPLDLPITLKAYIYLREQLGLPREENIRADRFFEVRPSPDVLEALGIDMTFVRLRRSKNWSPPPPLADGTEIDEWGVGRKKIDLPTGGALFEVTHSPWKDLNPGDIDLDSYPWPDSNAPGITDGLEEEARGIFENTNLAIMGRFGGPILEIGAYLRGYQQWMMDLVMYPDFSRRLLERVADIQINLDERGIRSAGPYCSVYKASGEDLGMQDRPLFSMKVWKTVLLPVLERRWKAARAAIQRHAPHTKIMLHSDGAIRPFISDIILSGIDLLDPVQGICQGMELDGLKRDFGDKLSFHGGVDTQHLLPFGTTTEVEYGVVKCIRSLGQGGGLILAPSHFIQSDVPPENIIAMYKAAHRHGKYPLGGGHAST
jgi:uroporphyrinogen decarboxylase